MLLMRLDHLEFIVNGSEAVTANLTQLTLVALQVILLLLIGTSLVFYLWGAFACSRFFTASRQGNSTPASRQDDSTSHQPVSVLIPVCGVDENAVKNWDSFCQQDYEQYEVVFGVMNPKDPAVPILSALVTKYPGRAKLIFCLEVRGINHQISNLIHLVENAQHEVIIFTNSDMYVTPGYLQAVTVPLVDPAIGVVTCAYLGHDPKSPVAALASLGRCVEFIPSVLVATGFEGGLHFALGATIATRKSVLDQIGGLQSVVNRIGSDYHIGDMIAAAGHRVELSPYILETDSGRESLLNLLQRELRWMRTSRWNRGLLYYSMACIYGSVYCVPLLLLSGFQSWAIIVCCVTIAVRVTQALVAIYSMGCPQLARWLWLLPVRDFLSFSFWVAGGFGQTIYWRGRRLQIGVGGVLTD